MYTISHVEGRTRVKFSNLLEKNLFIQKTQNILGLKSFEHSNHAPTVLINYEPNSPFAYIAETILPQKKAVRLTKEDVSSYVAPLLSNHVTKLLWLIAIFGTKSGFLQFSISTMLINRYINARFS